VTVETIPMTAYTIEPIMLAPLEAQSEDGPTFVCGMHDFQWTVYLSAQGRELWNGMLAEMRTHVASHGSHRAGESE